MDFGTICKHNMVISYKSYVARMVQLMILLVMPRLDISTLNSPCPSTPTFHPIFTYLYFQKSGSIESTT